MCRSRAVAPAANPLGITHAEVSPPNIATAELLRMGQNTGRRGAASAGYYGLLESGEDLLAVQVKLRRPDAVDCGQLLERRRIADGDRPQHGIRGDDERRHLVGAGAAGAPCPQRLLSYRDLRRQVGCAHECRLFAVGGDSLAPCHAEQTAGRESQEHTVVVERLDPPGEAAIRLDLECDPRLDLGDLRCRLPSGDGLLSHGPAGCGAVEFAEERRWSARVGEHYDPVTTARDGDVQHTSLLFD